MKRRGKIIATLVTLGLALSMVAIGVYSATLVSFGISGSIAYEIEDVYVNITTKVYSSDIIANNPNAFNASLVQEYGEMLGLNAFASSELDNSVETLANTSIGDIDTSKYTLVKSYTYSSLTEEGTNPITDLSLEFNSTDAKTYFIVINIENLSSAPVYAVVQDDKNVPANTVELNNGLQQNILQGEKNRNIVFALGVADFTRPIASGSKFECGIKVGLGDISQTPENLAKLNIAYTDAVSDYTASIKQDAKGVVVVPSTAPEQTRATNDIIAMMPVKQVSGQDEMMQLLNTGITHIYLPNTVNIIAPTAFTANVALTKIEGLDNVMSIGDYAFTACVKLSKIDLSDNCASIGTYTFNNCANLYAIDLPNNLSAISEQMFSDARSLETIDLKNVQTIGEDAFYDCTGLTTIDLGNVQTIGEDAFGFCKGLTSIDLGSVTEMGSNVFAACTGLTSVELGNVESIGSSAFYGCTGLTTIDLGNIKSIGDSAFCGCKGLTSVDLGGGSVESIGHHAFSGCAGLGELVISGSATEIDSYAFAACTGLTSVDLENVQTIGQGAFYTTGLTSITIPSSITNIANIQSAFLESKIVQVTNNSSLDITLNDLGIYNVGAEISKTGSFTNTLSKGEKYTTLTVGEKVYLMGFTDPSNHTAANDMPSNVTDIYKYAFACVDSLTSIIIPNGVQSIGERAFEDCVQLTNTTLPNSVQSIGEAAFSGCIGLTHISLGNVQRIDYYAFGDCTGIKNITIPNNVTTIGYQVFANWTAEQSIYFEGTSMPENLNESWKDSCYAKIYLNGVLQN